MGGGPVARLLVTTIAGDLGGEHSAGRISHPAASGTHIHLLLAGMQKLVAVGAGDLEGLNHFYLGVTDDLVAFETIDLAVADVEAVNELDVVEPFAPFHVAGVASLLRHRTVALADLKVALPAGDPDFEIGLVGENEPLMLDFAGGKIVAGRTSRQGLIAGDILEMAQETDSLVHLQVTPLDYLSVAARAEKMHAGAVLLHMGLVIE
jgi:hypothetical protein